MSEERHEKRDGSSSGQPYDRRHTWRRSEWISLSTVAVVIGWVWYASARTNTWDQTVKDVNDLKPVVEELVKMESANTAHWQDLDKYLRRNDRDK